MVVLDLSAPKQRDKALLELRKAPEFGLLPIFLAAELEDAASLAADLSDGVVANSNAAREQGARIWQALFALPHGKAWNDADMRLLRFLHTRPTYRLTPRRVWDHHVGYRFALLEAFKEEATSAAAWLDNLQWRKLLEPLALIDRTRHCPACDFTHLNYVDVCTQCASVDIENVPFLHCFTCGNIAPDAEFMQGGGDRPTCMKCTAQLRQVGVDYDHALTSFRCNACGVGFQDPKILAACLHCGKQTVPQELPARRICSWRLSSLGRTAARTGDLAGIFAPLDRFNLLMPTFFMQTLDWMLHLKERHHNNEFALMGVRFRNIGPLHMDDLIPRLRQALRSTDLLTRIADRDLLIVLPHTDADGAKQVRDKIQRLEQDIIAQEHLQLATALLHSSQCPAQERAHAIVARIDSELS